MSFQDEYKITSADRLDKGVYGLPDTPGMTTAAIQERFDSLGNLAIDKFNALVEAASDVVDGSDTKFPTNKAVQDYISGEGGAIIDDTTPSLHKAYSSQKVENMFGDVASRVIDDTEPLSNKTYSSEEIEEKLSNIPSPESIIDDDTASTDTTYSSSKLESDFISVSDTEEQTATDEFTTINGGLLSSLKVSLSPNQDLHGYDSPWVGGAGKNKLEDTFNTGTLLDVVITADNGVIDLNGTGTGENSFAIKSRNTSGNYIYMPKGSYIFSAQGIGSGVVIGTTYNGAFSEIARNDSGESVAFSITDNTPSDYKLADGSVLLAVYITVHARAYNHQKVYPMIRLSSVVDDSFEPYSNECPISGHTQVDVWNHQKNLCDDSLIVQGDIDNSAGADTADGSLKHIRSGYCNAESSTQYTVSHNHTIGSGTLKVFEYRSDKSFIRRTNAGAVTSLSYTFTTHSECKYIRIAIYDENGISKNNTWIQIELGSTATAYVPYNGYQVTVNLGGTYYSGTLDIVTGVFTPDTASVDLGTLTWTYEASWGAGSDFYALVSGLKPTSDYDEVTSALTSQYKPVSRNTMYNTSEDSIFGVMTNGALKIRDNRYTDAVTFTSAMSGVQLVYELATPTPIQLSPTMVKARVGENHLSAPLEGQEITESVYSPLAKWNAVIDDTTASNDTTYSSNKINSIVPQIDDNTTSASKVFSSLKTANLITELSERFDFSTTEKPLGWWTDGKVYYGKVINIMGCPKEMFGLMVDLGVEVDTFIGLFAVGNAQDDNYNGGYCMGGTIYCKVTKSEGQNTQIQPACAVMALSRASLLVLYTKVE